jgi:hypothetical protein
MAWFDKIKFNDSPKEGDTIEFKCGKQAFEIAFKHAMDEGKTMSEAAKDASEFSTTICKHLNLPQIIEPKKEGYEKWEQEFEKWDKGCQKFIGKPLPEVAIIIATLVASGAGASVLGALTAAKIENNNENNIMEVENGGTI